MVRCWSCLARTRVRSTIMHAEGRFCGAIDPDAVPLDFGKAVTLTGRGGLGVVPSRPARTRLRAEHIQPGRASSCCTRPEPADAWPLVNFTSAGVLRTASMLCGESNHRAQSGEGADAHAVPPALNQGSIYENQTSLSRRYFQAGRGSRREIAAKRRGATVRGQVVARDS